MMQKVRHEMVLDITHPQGFELWYCPICWRTVLIQWDPEFKGIVLDLGDDSALHAISKGGLVIDAINVPEQVSPEGEKSLQPWRDWLKTIDVDKLLQDGLGGSDGTS